MLIGKEREYCNDHFVVIRDFNNLPSKVFFSNFVTVVAKATQTVIKWNF